MVSLKQAVMIDYTNWRGERSKRRIVPMRLVWENNEWHPETQWLLEAIDVDKKEGRVFALANIHSWAPAASCGVTLGKFDKPQTPWRNPSTSK